MTVLFGHFQREADNVCEGRCPVQHRSSPVTRARTRASNSSCTSVKMVTRIAAAAHVSPRSKFLLSEKVTPWNPTARSRMSPNTARVERPLRRTALGKVIQDRTRTRAPASLQSDARPPPLVQIVRGIIASVANLSGVDRCARTHSFYPPLPLAANIATSLFFRSFCLFNSLSIIASN